MSTSQWLIAAIFAILMMFGAGWSRAASFDEQRRRAFLAMAGFNVLVAFGIVLSTYTAILGSGGFAVGSSLVLVGFLCLGRGVLEIAGAPSSSRAIDMVAVLGVFALFAFTQAPSVSPLVASVFVPVALISLDLTVRLTTYYWTRRRWSSSVLHGALGTLFSFLLLAQAVRGLVLGVNIDITETHWVSFLSLIGGFGVNVMQVLEVHADSMKTLRNLALTDTLTGLANRRALDQRLDELIATSQRSGRGFSIILADLDRLKSVNDAFGHAAGDQLLAAVATRLHSVLRHGDVLSRYGGDEFAILLPETDASAALRICNRLRVACGSEFEFEGENSPMNTARATLSFGIATSANGHATATEVLRRADEALYRSKAEGRDRVTVSKPQRAPTITSIEATPCP